MEIFLKKTTANICFAMLRVLDGIFELFGVLTNTGNSDVSAEGQEPTDLLSFFLENVKIKQIFTWILLISVALLGIFTIAGIIKNIVITKRPQSKTLLAFGGSFIAFFLVQIVLFGGIFLSNQVLRLIDEGFNVNHELTLSQQIMDIAVDDDGWYTKSDNTKYSVKDFVLPMKADAVFGNYKTNTWTGWEKTPQQYEEVIQEDGTTSWEISGNTYESGGIADLYKTNLFILCFATIIIFLLFIISVLTLAKRIFEIVYLYLCMPLLVSTIPFDDGTRFKLWRESMTSKILSIYGTVIALNLYILFLGIIGDGINTPISASWTKTLFNLVLMIGGALAASSGAALFGHLIGAQQDPGKNLGQSLYSGMMMGQAAAGIAKGASHLLFGKKQPKGGAGGGDGKRHGGLFRTAGKVLDTAGKILGGNNYKGMKTKVSDSYHNLKDTLKGNFMNKGGIGGIVGDKMQRFGDKIVNRKEKMPDYDLRNMNL